MNHKDLTPAELNLLRTKDGASAAVMGYLKAERGKVSPSVFNKIMNGLNYDKSNKGNLIRIAEEMDNNLPLKSLYVRAFKRELKIEDIPKRNYEFEMTGEAEEDEVGIEEADIFSHITNFLIDNESNNARLRELRKLQREGVYTRILMDNLQKHLLEELKGMPRAKYITTPVPTPQKGDRSLILLFTDWHIGAVVFNEKTGGYNFKKLKGSLQTIIEQVLGIINDLGITNVYVFHLGDIQEHIDMRNVNQAFESEFPATEQIAKANRLIVDVLLQLSKVVHVTFGMVAGNHDRFSGNKNDKVYNDNSVYIIMDNLFMLQEELGQFPNVTLIDNRKDTYEFVIEVAGRKIKCVHGDHEKKKDDVKTTRHMKDEPIDILIMGHIHTTRIIQEDYDRFHIYVGSPMGGNNFSKELNLPNTFGSQMVLVLTEGSRTPMFIPLLDI